MALIEPIAPTDPCCAQVSLVTGATRWLFVSGPVPADAQGRVPADEPSQYRLAWPTMSTQPRAAPMASGPAPDRHLFRPDSTA